MQWHPSQKIVKDGKDAVVATFELGNTVEFKRWVLGFGGHAMVISPSDLVAEVRRELQVALGKYGMGEADG
jgi:predicted DNA-binding transcriptional regulator YafY